MEWEWQHSGTLAAGTASRLFSVTKSGADFTPCARPAIVSLPSTQRGSVPVDATAASPPRPRGIPRGDFLSFAVAMSCQGKSDFKVINRFPGYACFAEAPGPEQALSEGNLRQRMDAHASGYQAAVEAAAIDLLRRSEARLTPPDQGPIALDRGITPLGNSQSKKEGLSQTNAGTDGYAPMPGCVGLEGYCLELELRAGRQHCQRGTPPLN